MTKNTKKNKSQRSGTNLQAIPGQILANAQHTNTNSFSNSYSANTSTNQISGGSWNLGGSVTIPVSSNNTENTSKKRKNTDHSFNSITQTNKNTSSSSFGDSFFDDIAEESVSKPLKKPKLSNTNTSNTGMIKVSKKTVTSTDNTKTLLVEPLVTTNSNTKKSSNVDTPLNTTPKVKSSTSQSTSSFTSKPLTPKPSTPKLSTHLSSISKPQTPQSSEPKQTESKQTTHVNTNVSLSSPIPTTTSTSTSTTTTKLPPHSNSPIASSILDELKCVVCFDLPNKPVALQCKNGHLYCEECYTGLSSLRHPQCALCRVNISLTPLHNTLAERILTKTPVECQFDCGEKITLGEKELHENSVCLKRVISCTYTSLGCGWEGVVGELSNHTNHVCLIPQMSLENIAKSMNNTQTIVPPTPPFVSNDDIASLLGSSVRDIIVKDIHLQRDMFAGHIRACNPFRLGSHVCEMILSLPRDIVIDDRATSNKRHEANLKKNKNLHNPDEPCPLDLIVTLSKSSKKSYKFAFISCPTAEVRLKPMLFNVKFSRSSHRAKITIPFSWGDVYKLRDSVGYNFRLIIVDVSRGDEKATFTTKSIGARDTSDTNQLNSETNPDMDIDNEGIGGIPDGIGIISDSDSETDDGNGNTVDNRRNTNRNNRANRRRNNRLNSAQNNLQNTENTNTTPSSNTPHNIHRNTAAVTSADSSELVMHSGDTDSEEYEAGQRLKSRRNGNDLSSNNRNRNKERNDKKKKKPSQTDDMTDDVIELDTDTVSSRKQRGNQHSMRHLYSRYIDDSTDGGIDDFEGEFFSDEDEDGLDPDGLVHDDIYDFLNYEGEYEGDLDDLMDGLGEGDEGEYDDYEGEFDENTYLDMLRDIDMDDPAAVESALNRLNSIIGDDNEEEDDEAYNMMVTGADGDVEEQEYWRNLGTEYDSDNLHTSDGEDDSDDSENESFSD